MRGKRLLNQICLFTINDSYRRGDYIRKNHVFYHCGKAVSFQPRKIPLYGELISVGDNVVVGSDVIFCTHDGLNSVINRARCHVTEKAGCIKIGNNCFIGAGAILLYDTYIGDDCVVAAGAVVIRDVPSGSIVGGVPAKVIGRTEDIIEKYKRNHSFKVFDESIDSESVDWFWNDFQRKRRRI